MLVEGGGGGGGGVGGKIVARIYTLSKYFKLMAIALNSLIFMKKYEVTDFCGGFLTIFHE